MIDLMEGSHYWKKYGKPIVASRDVPKAIFLISAEIEITTSRPKPKPKFGRISAEIDDCHLTLIFWLNKAELKEL